MEDWAKFEKIKWVHKFDGKTILKALGDGPDRHESEPLVRVCAHRA